MSLNALSSQVADLFSRKARSVRLATLLVRFLLVLGGAAVVGFFGLFPPSGPPITEVRSWTTGQTVAVVGLVVNLVGALVLTITDLDSTRELEAARRAIDLAKDQRLEILQVYDELLNKENALERIRSLLGAYHVTRGAFETALVFPMEAGPAGEDKLVEKVLEDLVARRLRIALNFGLADIWTICVYKTEWDDQENSRTLRLVAHHRSLLCDKADARFWREGVGVAGVALAKRDEVTVPDLEHKAVGTSFRLNGQFVRQEDRARYRSMFAVPVFVGSEEVPWGIALATSNRADHFGTDDSSGFQPEEAIRALAGLVALTVAVARARVVLSKDQTPNNGPAAHAAEQGRSNGDGTKEEKAGAADSDGHGQGA